MNASKVLALAGLGAALVLVALNLNSKNQPGAGDDANAGVQGEGPVASEDHWHSAYGIWVCDAFVDPMPEFTAPRIHGTHTHGDGLIHIHPFTNEFAGKDATLVSFIADAVEVLGGAALTTDHLGVPGSKTYQEAQDRCDGADATVSISVWRDASTAAEGADPDAVLTHSFESLYFAADGEAYAIAFSADPSNVPPPPSVSNLETERARAKDRADDVTDAPIAIDVSGPLAFRPVAADLAPDACPDDGSDPNLYPKLGEGDDVIACYEITEEGLGEEVVAEAEAIEQEFGGWQVELALTDDGIDAFNRIARTCYDQGPACPTGELAILIGRSVISAPRIQAPSFEADQISISGDFTEADARALAEYLQS